MDKYIGLDMDRKKTVACVVLEGRDEWYAALGPDVHSLRQFQHKQKVSDCKVHAAFEISGQAGYICMPICSTV